MKSQTTNINFNQPSGTLFAEERERERERVIFTSYKFFIINIFKPGIPVKRNFRAFLCGVRCFHLTLTLFFLFFLTGSNGVYSQSISPEVFPSSGDYYTGTNAALSWTIGEGVTETFSGTNTILTQGFQQSLYTITSIEETPGNNYQISVYPNPATDLININFQSDDKTSFKIELIDLQGKRLYYQNINSNSKTLDLKQFPGSIYFLKVYTNDNKLLKSYKITKL